MYVYQVHIEKSPILCHLNQTARQVSPEGSPSEYRATWVLKHHKIAIFYEEKGFH
jgi:hypothetical protein